MPHDGEQEAIREIIALKVDNKPLRAIAAAMVANGHTISHEGVAGRDPAGGQSETQVRSPTQGDGPVSAFDRIGSDCERQHEASLDTIEVVAPEPASVASNAKVKARSKAERYSSSIAAADKETRRVVRAD